MSLFLTFSDAAKFADVARNFVLGKGWGSSFSFFGPSLFDQIKNPLFVNTGILPLHSLFIALSFKIFGVNDFAVIATSFFFYLLSLVFVFFLAKKIFKSGLVSFLSALAVGFNWNLIDYATSGASESLFIAEIVLAFYLLSFKRKSLDMFSFLVFVLMYFTRPHAFIYIAGGVLFWLLLRFKVKKALVYFSLLALAAIFFDLLVLSRFSGRFFLYSVLGRGQNSILQHSSSWAVSDTLRGLGRQGLDFVVVFKKVFYNLYNFYKLMPNILNPYLFVFFVMSFFVKEKSRLASSFEKTALLVFALVFLVGAATIPFYRYLHPVIPFVYILAVGTLVGITGLLVKDYRLWIKDYRLLRDGKNSIIYYLVSLILVLFFAVGQTVGVLLLDSRFEARMHNVGKPPIYVEFSKILKENTSPNQLIITNLDTWGSWYGERKTVWFPLEPKMIIDPKTGEIPFDSIYLTSYKIDDPNYYMGDKWRVIFENPDDEFKWNCEGCDLIAKDFDLKGIYKIPPEENYEKQEGIGILWVRK